MNHAQIRAFHAVATQGSFTKAARALGVSQPAVTFQMKALEETYGVALVDRRGHRLRLTDLGERLLEVTRRIFACEQEADELLSAARELCGGHLHVAADGPYHVMALLAAFIARYPGVRVSVAMGNSRRVLADLLEYRADVAVMAGVEADERLHAIAFSCEPLVLFVARDHPWGQRTQVPISELDGLPMVLREEGSITRRIFEAAITEAGVRPRVVLEIGSREALREAVAAGLGAGVVSAAELGSDERLHTLSVSGASLESWEYVVCLKERRNLRGVGAFLALVGEAGARRAAPAA